MDGPTSPLVEIALTAARTLALQLGERLAVRVVHNAPLLLEWRGHEDAMPGSLQLLLEELLPLAGAQAMLRQIEAAATTMGEGGMDLGTTMLRPPAGGAADRHAAFSLHRGGDASQPLLLLLLRDVTPQTAQQQALAQAQDNVAAALTALRTPPQPLRLFLSSAMASMGALRATMKLPARDQASVQAKLTRLKESADQIGSEAHDIGLGTVVAACREFALGAVALREKQHVSGNDLLPLAPLLDQIASSIGNSARIEEQRYIAPARPRAATRERAEPESRKDAESWAHAAEKRWNSFLRQRGEELGTLVKLQVLQAQLVPAGLRRDIDDMLQHLLRNAVEHGIETPEQRLAADKSAAGEISVKFEQKREGLTMTVRDDGCGFDVERIGRAAVLSGLVAEESLLEYDPGEVVGLIFKPNFSTENLAGEAGRGRGMSFLRRAVTRLGGQITVATKPGHYTRFMIQLPAAT